MSIVQMLAKQQAIAQRNKIMYQSLQNSAMRRNMLANPSFMGNLEDASAMETALALDDISNSTQLMAINAELQALDNAKLDYFA